MSHPLEPTLQTFGINDWMFNIALRDMPQDKAAFKVHEDTNAFNRIALHTLISRHNASQATEMGLDPLPWDNLGEGMESGFLEGSEVPTLEEIKAEWLNTAFMKKLTTVPEKALNAPSPMPIPGNPNGTVKDFMYIIVVHESVHIGQLSLLLKAATGKSIMNIDNATAG